MTHVLDLQRLTNPDADAERAVAGNSSISFTLCGDSSTLSVLLCHGCHCPH
ncbi:class III lanthipeptide [Nonomuraea typhae]|uniref:Class III lanthipeptide n=1 Tax=Nonomuraea typhae TaxID=2603600 RepID=A0ABW7Z5Z1_9ACTN|nr:class III lanthipeptide [Nonomuraea typhae]